MNRDKSLDFIKMCAILFVIVDHTIGRLYSNTMIQKGSYCSVTLFIFVVGITSYFSLERNRRQGYDYRYTVKRLKSIIYPYLIAVSVYVLYQNKMWDLKIFMKAIFDFAVIPPSYYVLVFIQLVIVAPILYKFIKVFEESKGGRKYVILLCEIIAVVVLSVLCTKYTIVNSACYVGGRYLLGGSYLIVFYVGMLSAKYFEKLKHLPYVLKGLIVLGGICYSYMYMNSFGIVKILDEKFSVWTVNPPGVSLMIYALFVFFILLFVYELLEKAVGNISTLDFILNKVVLIGKYTLDIFLWHMLILAIHFGYIANSIGNIWILRCVTILLAVGLPIGMRICYIKIKGKIVSNIFYREIK